MSVCLFVCQSETGGRLENLRTSTTNEKVRRYLFLTGHAPQPRPPLQVRSYHSAFYRPDNMCVIVTGQVDPIKLFTALQPFEDKIAGKV